MSCLFQCFTTVALVAFVPSPSCDACFVRCGRILSGPMRFEYHDDARRWLNTRDGETELRDLLAKEMDEKCGVSLF